MPLQLNRHRLFVIALLVLVPYGLIYFGVTYLLRVEECGALFARLARLRY